MGVAPQAWVGRTGRASLLLLPRFVDARTLERCVDHYLAGGLVTVASLVALIESLPSHAVHGRRVLLELLRDRAGGIGHRSGLEQRVARWLKAAGLLTWRRNHPVDVRHGPSVEVDFAWPQVRVGLEVSPFYTHGSRAAQERDAHRRRLLVEAGWRIVEATDPDLEHPRAFARTVRALRVMVG